MFVRRSVVISIAAIGVIGCGGTPAPPGSDAPPAATSTAATPTAASVKPDEHKAHEVTPEVKQQLRALFEPLRKTVYQFQRDQSAFVEALKTQNDAAMEKASAASNKTMATIQAQKQAILPKATATGATDHQIEAEWTLWLQEVRKEAEAAK